MGWFEKQNLSSFRKKSLQARRLRNLGVISFLTLWTAVLLASSGVAATKPAAAAKTEALNVKDLPKEVHLKNVRALTSSGENAEAYFSFDGKQLVYQAKERGELADTIWTMNIDGTDKKQVSSGKGATTCSYFLPDNKSIIYASTHATSEQAPPPPDFSMGYVWPLHANYEIFKKDLSSGAVTALTDSPGYDAEATVSPDGKKIVFTSMRDGDLELYTMNIDGSDVRRLTHLPGYDGGAFFSPDSKQIVYRASRFEDPKELATYQALLKKNMIRPSKLEIFVMNADGTNQQQITNNGAANFAPFFHPSGKKILFASNFGSEDGRDFNIFMVDIASRKQTQITYNETFDSFPMFSPDGKKLVFASNRFGKQRGETNVFIADWVE
jgi:Tol biopolymer transport system component